MVRMDCVLQLLFVNLTTAHTQRQNYENGTVFTYRETGVYIQGHGTRIHDSLVLTTGVTKTWLRPGPREPATVELVETNLRHLVVNRVPVVIQSRGLQDDPRRPHHHRHREDPEEQPVQHHRHVLPVLQDLQRETVLNPRDHQNHHLHCPLSFLFMLCYE